MNAAWMIYSSCGPHLLIAIYSIIIDALNIKLASVLRWFCMVEATSLPIASTLNRGSMRQIDLIDSKSGVVAIYEDRRGGRIYLEGSAIQTYADPDGTSLLSYVRLMADVLSPCKEVLVLGCAGGSLATMLHRSGKRVTVVDNNPESFRIARHYFGMAPAIRCVAADFRDYLETESAQFDGIAVDIGGPTVAFQDLFDAPTCEAICKRLSPAGRLAMNLIIPEAADTLADHIASGLMAEGAGLWIYDQIGERDFNAVLVRLPPTEHHNLRDEVYGTALDNVPWTKRPPRSPLAPYHHRQKTPVSGLERQLAELFMQRMFDIGPASDERPLAAR
ncbi:spermidine synthase [Labrys neptuniae]|uniref:Methyltransferase domain-containing protein n=1 Tax=Labrys neptuniae TaxID=376174 RepID=A0ABV3PNY7_9HYPH